MGNPWLAHVKDVSKKHKGIGLKKILQLAKKTYKKSPVVHKKRRKTRRKTHKKHRKRRRKTHKKRRKH
jgi:hypothetical protein